MVTERVKSSSSSSSSLVSIRVVTCLTVSSMVAPGRAAVMTIVLMVNCGSSSRPKRV